MYRENVNVEQLIKGEISKTVDQWVNDLIKNKVAAPMPQQHQRGLWDRVKGTLSNLWYAGRGGRNNQNNPYYWKNRFGDELGSQTESYDPRVFTLYEFKEIKKAIDEAEALVEEIQPDLEKLQIVKMIRSAAEDLKNKLFNLFSQACPSQGTGTTGTQANARPDGTDAQASTEPARQGDEEEEEAYAGNAANMSQSPRERAAEELRAGLDDTINNDSDISSDPILPEENYEKYKPNPKKNKEKDIKTLQRQRHLVDYVLHKDFKESTAKFLVALKKLILELKHDALIKKENQDTMEMINLALEKVERMNNELG